MFNLKRIKKLEKRINDLELFLLVINDSVDLLADEMGAEIVECDCCGKLMLDFGDVKDKK